MCRTLSSCRLYSWIRLACTSKIVPQSIASPATSLTTAARRALLRLALGDQRHAAEAVGVSGPSHGDLLQEAAVDLVNDLQVPWQHALQQADRPDFQRLRHERVVGVAAGRGGDLPGPLPREIAL